MTLTHAHKAPHHHRARAATTARIGQFTGALLVAGGVAALALRYLAGAWAGLTGLVMVSAFRAHPRKVLAIAAHERPRRREIARYPWFRRRPGH